MGGGGEVAIQIYVTGGVYSWGRVGTSAAIGLGAGVLIVGSLYIPVVGPFIAGGLLIAYGYFSDIGSAKELEDQIKQLVGMRGLMAKPFLTGFRRMYSCFSCHFSESRMM